MAWGKNDALHLWDQAAAPRFRLQLSHGPRLSPDGSCLALITGKQPDGRVGGVALYDTASGKRTALCVAHKAEVWALAFRPDGTRIASADDDGLVCVWNAK